MADEKPERRGRYIALLAVCGILLCLPEWQYEDSALSRYLFSLTHVPVFFLITWALLRLTPISNKNRLIIVLGISCVLVLVFEMLQTWFGRSSSLMNMLLCLSGVFLALFWMAGKWRIALVLIVVLALPELLMRLDRFNARRAYPVLADFESLLEIKRWNATHCSLTRTRDHASHGGWALKVEVSDPAGLYQKAVSQVFKSDWSHIQEFAFDYHNPSEQPLSLVLKIDDHEPRSGSSQVNLVLQPGTGSVRLQREMLILLPGGHQIDPANIASFGLYLVAAEPGTTLFIDHVRVKH